jgi:ATP-binding cassette subfamily F protein 3
MDEPTNHLDIKSKNVLKQALIKFDGTLILVSHDRDFLQNLTNKVYEFKDQKIKEFLGDIDYYLDQRQVESFREIEKKEKIVSTNKKSVNNQAKRSLKKKINNIESKISKLEKEISKIDQNLSENYDVTVSAPNFFENYDKKKSELETLMKKWEKLNLF